MKLTVKRYGDCYKLIYFKRGTINSDERSFNMASCHVENGGEKEECNLSRAKATIREYALCNKWEYFVTLTLNKDKQDRYDIDGYVKDLGYWIGNYNKKFHTKLRYLLIPEQHKDGAWHMHGLFSGVAADSLCSNANGYLSLPYYAQRFGFISLSPVRDGRRTAAYITKYVSKAISSTDIALQKHMFYHSRGLEKAELLYEINVLEMPIEVWQNDFVGIEWADNDEALSALLARFEQSS